MQTDGWKEGWVMRPTIYDVAKASCVSPSTVSKVIHDRGRISPSTRQRVLDTMRALNFKPNVVASALKAKRTYTLGLLLADITNPFCNLLAKAVEDTAMDNGYNVLICSTENDASRQRSILEMLIQRQVDGYILSSAMNQSGANEEWMVNQGLKIVFADRWSRLDGVPSVSSDNVRGGYLATSHLLQAGHRRIGIVLENVHLSSSRDRLQGYLQAHREYGVEASMERVVYAGFGIDAGRRMARDYSSHFGDGVTALFVVNDIIAIGFLQEALALGYHIPEDISLVGYDDIPVSSMVHPALTTVHQPIDEMARHAVSTLLRVLDGEDCPAVLLDPILVQRSSVRQIPVDIRDNDA